MSNLRVNTVRAVNDGVRVSFPAGASITGVVDATGISVSGVGTITTLVATNVTVGGVQSSGIITATAFTGDGSQLTSVSSNVQGFINPGITSSVIYSVPTTAGIAFSVASGVGTITKYIVHSIHLTNVSGADVSVSGSIYSGEFSLGNLIPMPQRSSLELLKEPKLLSAGQFIKLGASAVSSIQAHLTFEPMLDSSGAFTSGGMTLINADTYYDVFNPATATFAPNGAMLSSLLISNRNDIFDSRCTVVITDQTNNIQAYLAFEIIVPANATVELFENVKHIPANFKIRAQSSVANKIDLIYFGRRTNPII